MIKNSGNQVLKPYFIKKFRLLIFCFKKEVSIFMLEFS